MTRIWMVAVMAFVTAGAFAQVGRLPASSVKQITDNPINKQQFVLQGILVSQIGGAKYTFSDDTGQIVAQIERDDLPPGFKVGERARVELRGEVEKAPRQSAEIDVESMHLL